MHYTLDGNSSDSRSFASGRPIVLTTLNLKTHTPNFFVLIIVHKAQSQCSCKGDCLGDYTVILMQPSSFVPDVVIGQLSP